MGLSHSPRIVTDGLVLCLDAANKRSYPGAGTTWTDRSASGYSGTLTNGPTFSSDGGGCFVFDGSDDESNTTTYLPAYGSNPRSICLWFYYNVSGKKNVVGFGATATGQLFDVITWPTNGYHRIVTHHYDSGKDTISTLPLRNTINLNSWNYFCATYGSGTVSIYTNGVFSNSKSLSLNTSSSVLYIGRGVYSSYNHFNGKVSQVSLYDKELTADEIRQNYLATKGRYE
jgi:hypothetical protein